MKLFKKVLGIITGFIAAVTLTGCINFSGYYDNADKYLIGTQYYDGELKTLDIDWTQGKVTLIQDKTAEHITVREDNELPDEKKVHSYFVDGTLYVKFCKSGYIYTHVNNSDKQLFVTFPSLENLYLDITSGAAVIEEISGDKIDIEITSGNIELGSAIANTFNVKTTSGEINLGAVYAQKFTCKLTSGKIKVDSLSTSEGTFKSTSGSINAKVDEADKLKFDVTSGNVILTIPEAGAKLTLKKTSGKFSSTREHTVDKNVYTFGNGSCEISINITSGDVTIN